MSNKSNQLAWWERLPVAGAVLLVLYVPFHGFFSVAVGVVSRQPLLVKAWKEVLLLGLVLLALVVVGRRPELAKRFFASRLNQLIIGFVAVEVIVAVILPGSALTKLAGLAIDTRYLLAFLLIRIVVWRLPKAADYLWQAVAVGALFVVGFGLLQQYILPPDILAAVGYSKATIAPYLTVDNNPQYIRINSTLRGPNPLGAYSVIILAALLAWTASQWKKWGKWRLVGVGIATLGCLSVLYASYSRSAWLAAVIVAVVIGTLSLPKQLQRKVGLIGVVVVIVGAVGYVSLQNTAFVRTIINHKDPANASQVDSNLGHVSSLAESGQHVLTQPLGAGVGSTGSASLLGDTPVIIESQFLFVAHEAGWLGLGLYVAILTIIMWQLWARRRDWRAQALLASGLGLVVIGFVQPVFADDTIAYLWWALAGAMVSLREPLTKRSDRE